MKTYRGILNIAAAASVDYTDINPPIPEGMVGQVVGLSLGIKSNDTANEHCHVLLSAKASGRTSYDLYAEGFASDLILLYTPYIVPVTTTHREITSFLRDGFLFQDGYVADVPIFGDNLRMFVGAPDAVVAAGKDIYVAYEVTVDEVKLTNELLQALYQKAY